MKITKVLEIQKYQKNQYILLLLTHETWTMSYLWRYSNFNPRYFLFDPNIWVVLINLDLDWSSKNDNPVNLQDSVYQ